jgi:hypothetical protein
MWACDTKAWLTRRSWRGDSGGQIAEIEEQRATAETKIDEQPGIGKRIVHQSALNEPGHRPYAIKV